MTLKEKLELIDDVEYMVQMAAQAADRAQKVTETAQTLSKMIKEIEPDVSSRAGPTTDEIVESVVAALDYLDDLLGKLT